MIKNKSLILDENKAQKITKKINDNFLIVLNDLNDKNINKTIHLDFAKNSVCKIYCIIVNFNNLKEYVLNLNQDLNSHADIKVKIFGFKNSYTKVLINSNIPKNAQKTYLNQEINGYLFSDDATILATPSMNISNNKIVANHSVNVGSINPEKLFYLMSRGITKKSAINLLIKSEYQYLKDLNISNAKQYYKKVDNKISKNI